MPGFKLINTIQSIAKLPPSEIPDLLFGEVLSTSPLRVKVDNRFEIGEEFLVLSELVKEKNIMITAHQHSISADTTGSGGDPAHSHSIPGKTTSGETLSFQLWRGLLTGDTVRIIRLNHGQLFYIMEREG